MHPVTNGSLHINIQVKLVRYDSVGGPKLLQIAEGKIADLPYERPVTSPKQIEIRSKLKPITDENKHS